MACPLFHRPAYLPSPVLCAMASPKPAAIKVVVNGACSPLGKAAISAVVKARGMELGGAVDSTCVGKDAGEVAGLEEPLELPISKDLVMVLGSLSQGSSPGVMVDLSSTSNVLENVRQATAFGLRSVVAVQGVEMDKVAILSSFCEKANMDFPSTKAIQLAQSISGVGQQYNKGDLSTNVLARGAVVGDGVRIHSLNLSGLLSSTAIHFSAPGEVLSFRHDMTDVEALIPGLMIAIRRVVRLTSLVYGLEKIL